MSHVLLLPPLSPRLCKELYEDALSGKEDAPQDCSNTRQRGGTDPLYCLTSDHEAQHTSQVRGRKDTLHSLYYNHFKTDT